MARASFLVSGAIHGSASILLSKADLMPSTICSISALDSLREMLGDIELADRIAHQRVEVPLQLLVARPFLRRALQGGAEKGEVILVHLARQHAGPTG